MTDTINDRLRRGEVIAAGSKLYRLCGTCGGLVQINKFLLGDLHLCLSVEERAAKGP